MSNMLFIRLPADADAAVEWMHGAEPGRVHIGSLAEAASDGQSEAVVFVPSAQLVLCSARLPTRNRVRMAQALPYALEEQLAQDIDQMHFAAGTPLEGLVPAAALATATMDFWLQRLRQAGIEPRALIPDVLALPWQPQHWTVLLESNQALVRTGPAAGWTCEPDDLTYMLQVQTRQGPTPQGIRILTADGTEPVPSAIETTVETVQEPLPEPVLTLMARSYGNDHGINLLQGAYQPSAAGGGSVKHWRWVAALALLLIGVELTATWMTHIRLERRLQQTQQQIEARFRAAFPDVTRIVDARVQMQQRLDRLRKSAAADRDRDAFLQLLAQAAPALKAPESMRILRLQYRQRRLEVDVNAPSFESLERVKQALTARGLVAEVVSASAAEQGVSGRLQVRERAS